MKKKTFKFNKIPTPTEGLHEYLIDHTISTTGFSRDYVDGLIDYMWRTTAFYARNHHMFGYRIRLSRELFFRKSFYIIAKRAIMSVFKILKNIVKDGHVKVVTDTDLMYIISSSIDCTGRTYMYAKSYDIWIKKNSGDISTKRRKPIVKKYHLVCNICHSLMKYLDPVIDKYSYATGFLPMGNYYYDNKFTFLQRPCIHSSKEVITKYIDSGAADRLLLFGWDFIVSAIGSRDVEDYNLLVEVLHLINELAILKIPQERVLHYADRIWRAYTAGIEIREKLRDLKDNTIKPDASYNRRELYDTTDEQLKMSKLIEDLINEE